MLTILSGVFTNRVQLSGTSTKCGIPSKCLNTHIVHCLSMRTEVWKIRAPIVHSTNTQKLTSTKSLLIFFGGWGEGAGQDNLDLRLLQRSRSTFSRAERRSSVNKILVTAKREVSEFLCDYTIIFNYTFLCTLDSSFPTFAHLLINVYQFLHSLQDIKGIQGIDHHPFDN